MESDDVASAVRVQIQAGVVDRPASPASQSIHSFLRYLQAKGEMGAPTPINVDGDRERLHHIDGQSGRDGWFAQHSVAGLRSAARLLRRLHDTSIGWVPPTDVVFNASAVDGPERVYCHGDPGPWNFVWRNGLAVGLIDWEFLHPAPRLDDVAYALLWFAPLRDDQLAREWHHFPAVPDRRARVAAFLDAYGPLPGFDLVDTVVRRRTATIELERQLAAAGAEPQRTWVAEGHLEEQEAEIRWLVEHRHFVE